jgi:hypothetical protein
MFSRRTFMTIIAASMLLCAARASAQEVIVQDGPPPALRKNLDAFQKAFNSGKADEYEAMAKTAFTPEYLKQQTPEQRKAEYTKWHEAFGSIKFRRVNRNGMDAPLEIEVEGTVGGGTMWINVNDDTSKLFGVKAQPAKK